MLLGVALVARPSERSTGDTAATGVLTRKILHPSARWEAIAPMHDLHTTIGAIHVMQVTTSAFLAILFLQSGIDKLVDRAGNVGWLSGHFAKSPLRGMVPLLVTIITILELVAGALSAVGCLLIFFRADSTLAFYGAVVSAFSIVA